MTMIEFSAGSEISGDGGWRKSTRCVPDGDCVEINRGTPDRIGVRDSKHADAASTLEFGQAAWNRFLGRLNDETSQVH